uniref:Uncharacterized protein n=1 Tax=Timema genevievae TaxID=629358 RepID=A0A7R9K963_TIMGE|nr:unnamed protein product [Timema genevievae]
MLLSWSNRATMLLTSSPMTVGELVLPLVAEFGVQKCLLLLAGSLARVDPAADVSLLEGDILLVEEGRRETNPRGECDIRFRLTEGLLHSECEYRRALGSAKELYGGAFRKLMCLDEEEHRLLFGGLDLLQATSKELCAQIQAVLENWDTEKTQLGMLVRR